MIKRHVGDDSLQHTMCVSAGGDAETAERGRSMCEVTRVHRVSEYL
jgi:hypothetical protein